MNPQPVSTATTVVVNQPPTIIQQPAKKERFADKILINILITLFFPFWVFIWCCMCICESK